MAKAYLSYWNPLEPQSKNKWKAIAGLEHIAEELTLSIDHKTGEYTRLTRFHPRAATDPFGGKAIPNPKKSSL